jgi:hypothetical protein
MRVPKYSKLSPAFLEPGDINAMFHIKTATLAWN